MEKKSFTNSEGYKLTFRSGTGWNDQYPGWYMECRTCSSETRVGSNDLRSVQCSKCVQSSLASLGSVCNVEAI
jgi:hypothetical protein